MTKRYARIASVQVSQAVNGLDAVLGSLPEGEQTTSLEALSHVLVTLTESSKGVN